MKQLPEETEKLLDEYCDLMKDTLGMKYKATYLYGSIALGQYESDTSDIDFVTILSNCISNSDVDLLKESHDHLSHEYKIAKKLDGMYITEQNIGKTNDEMMPYPYTHDGKFVRSGYWDINHVTWYIMKTTAKVIAGERVSIPTRWEDVLSTFDFNLNVYWKNAFKKIPVRVDSKTFAEAVLTLCRIYYSLEEETITTKRKAGLYALSHSEWPFKPQIEKALYYRGKNTELLTEVETSNATAHGEEMIVLCNELLTIQKRKHNLMGIER
ncbi:aminoglycoside adenylyltransferase domain-containing protein [Pseudalkalibacillus caeni]|uniref:DUF4111 domain-containing protein n=1 Tax=Exobacillus caeni TaxID=2574798 RepID=A0A5R9F5B0_9BACL|nr:aminoglycoside adenylyltransferase domain-containing protein [Pseudalkalibacillus caeni]TLS37526.1 DUF4111 domain-containing protein [Pseudalkalibacillus caeni]